MKRYVAFLAAAVLAFTAQSSSAMSIVEPRSGPVIINQNSLNPVHNATNQLSSRLDHLEQKVSLLEQRIQHLEERIHYLEQPMNQNMNTPPNPSFPTDPVAFVAELSNKFGGYKLQDVSQSVCDNGRKLVSSKYIEDAMRPAGFEKFMIIRPDTIRTMNYDEKQLCAHVDEAGVVHHFSRG